MRARGSGFGSMAEFASKAVAEFSDTERVVIMACPSSNPDLFTMREVSVACLTVANLCVDLIAKEEVRVDDSCSP